MIGTYVAAALICAASLLVGRALLLLAGRPRWSWLEPAAGLGAIFTVTGVLARAPGHGTSATLGLVLLLVAAAVILALARRPRSRRAEKSSRSRLFGPSAGGGLALGRAGGDRGGGGALDPVRDRAGAGGCWGSG